MVSDRKTVIADDVRRQRELEELFSLYVNRLNRGEELNPQEIFARHPGMGGELIAALENYVDPAGAPASPPSRTFGDYTIRRELGRGGMGVVYDAWQNSLERRVALKVLPIGIAASDQAFERFIREARTAAKLDHPNVVRVHGMGIESNTPYFVMEHVEGPTLAHLISLRGAPVEDGVDAPTMPDGLSGFEAIAETFAETADGLQHAHETGVIHRDIKPSNLILDPTGKLRILDFGLARFEGEASLTLTGDMLGTPAYMSPEQARRRQIPVDHRTDIYSLGATLYEVLTRQPPIDGEDQQEMLSRIIDQDPQPLRRVDPAIPRDLETIVLKCLRKNPRDRYQSAGEMAADLRRFAGGEPIRARLRPQWRKAVRWAERRAVRIGVIIMIAGLLSAIAILMLSPSDLTNSRILTMDDMEQNNFLSMRPSPDGKHLAYSRIGTDGAICVRDMRSGEETQLTDDGFSVGGFQGPPWSPDGRRIAYTLLETRQLRIVDVNTGQSSVPEGSESLRLTPFDWSPDGRSIVCGQVLESGAQALVAITPETGATRILVDEAPVEYLSASYSKNGRRIAYSSTVDDNQDVYVITANGSDRQRVTDATDNDEFPLWSPDGKRIIFMRGEEVWTAPMDDGRPAARPEFLQEVGRSIPNSWHADGTLYMVKWEMIKEFRMLPVDGDAGRFVGTPTRLEGVDTRLAYRGVWSPGLKRFAYMTYGDGRLHLYSTEDGSLRSFKTGLDRRSSNLWWPPNGNRALFVLRGTPHESIAEVDFDSNRQRALFDTVEFCERLHLSPDGERMVFYRWVDGQRNNGRRELVVAQAGEREGRVIAREAEEEIGGFSNWIRPRFSPDGRRILFASESGRLWVAEADGSARRIVATAEEVEYEGDMVRMLHSAVWSPDGRFFAYDNWRRVFIVNVESGAQETYDYRETTKESVDMLSQWSPDGGRLVIASGRGGGPELWTIRNLLSSRESK
jgi:serine/threonine protein kinase